MKIALLSDIHSNYPALTEVLKEVELAGAEHIFFLGDTFGYYPWAFDTFRLIQKIQVATTFILGNHDQLILDAEAPKIIPSYWQAAKQNEKELKAKAPEALKMLETLQPFVNTNIDGLQIKMYHGSPEDPLLGRFYPDNHNDYDWFPGKDEWLFLGHTHYPFFKITRSGGYIINPGSVGQPRDGSIQSSWALIDLNIKTVVFRRTAYPIEEAIAALQKLNWEPHAIKALEKKYSGTLKN